MTWTERPSPVKVGDTVMYSKTWLRSAGPLTRDTCFAKGTVKITLAANWGSA